MISALSWIPKGAAAQFPKRMNLTQEDFAKIQAEIGAQVQEAKVGLEKAKMKTSNQDDELKEYNLDTYDDGEQEEAAATLPIFGNTLRQNFQIAHDEEDPYINLDDTEDIEEEMKELEILPTDNLIIACKTEDEMSHLVRFHLILQEVYLYEEQEDNLYVHHDILLPSFPLCAEWIDYSPNTESNTGNLVAIGTFEPQIEIWDLDTVDCIYPSVILGSAGADPMLATTRKKRAAARKANDSRHVGAVTSISWNRHHRNLILSASVDSTVKLWDLSGDCSKAVKSYNHHSDKVTAVAWNPVESTVFLTGGYDNGGRVCVLDSRYPDQVASWDLKSDVECVKWDPHRPERFLVSTEDGLVRCFDARNASEKALYTIHAHDSAVSALDFNAHIDGLLITGGADKTVKVWDVRDGVEKRCICTRDLQVGKVFSANFCTDSPWVIAASGSKGKVIVWNLEGNVGVQRAFRGVEIKQATRPEVVSVEDDDEEEKEAGEDALVDAEDESDDQDEEMQQE